MTLRALLAFCLAFAVSLQLLVLGPLAILNGNAEIPLAPRFFLGWPLVAALAVAVVVGFGILRPLLEAGRYRWPTLCAALGVALFVSFYGFAPDLGPLDGRADPFSRLTLRGGIELLVLVGLF